MSVTDEEGARKNIAPQGGTAIVSSPTTPSDRDVLHQFGYAQQLLRDMGGFSNFAISFSIISILTGAITLYGNGLQAGGPVVMGFGWPLVTLFVLLIAASLGELASAVPTSGALYHWSALLGGASLGWLTAWLNLIGLVAAITGIDYGCAQFLAPLCGMPADFGHCMGFFALLSLSQAVLNHVGIRTVARLNDFSVIYHIAGVAIVVGALVLFAPLRPVRYLFTQTFTSTPGKPYWFLFMTGLLQAQWTYTGYDASAHTIEETKDARVRAPWGIYLSVAVSGFVGYIMLACITLAIRDLPAAAGADNPIEYIFEQALGGRAGTAVVWVMTLAMWFCGLSCVTSTSRLIFAFSRDHGLPLWQTWAHVSRRFRTPAAAVWLASALAYALPAAVWLLVKAAPRALDFNRLYTAVTGISTIALYLAYGLPVLLKLRARRLGAWTDRTDGPWSLGRWSTPVGAVGILWIAFITVLFVLPPNELTGYMFALTMVALAVLYFTTARGRFKGPVPQAKGEAELARLEAELEQ